MTLAELLAAKATILAEIASSGGVNSATVDGMTVTANRKEQLASIQAEIDRLSAPSSALWGVKIQKLVPSGCG